MTNPDQNLSLSPALSPAPTNEALKQIPPSAFETLYTYSDVRVLRFPNADARGNFFLTHPEALDLGGYAKRQAFPAQVRRIVAFFPSKEACLQAQGEIALGTVADHASYVRAILQRQRETAAHLREVRNQAIAQERLAALPKPKVPPTRRSDVRERAAAQLDEFNPKLFDWTDAEVVTRILKNPEAEESKRFHALKGSALRVRMAKLDYARERARAEATGEEADGSPI